MKLKPKSEKTVTLIEAEKLRQEKIKEQNSKRGKRSRNKGANFERTVAKIFKEKFGIDLVRTPQSGGFAKKSEKADDFRGDIVSADKDYDLKLHVECKNAQTWSLPAWLRQAESDCPKGKIPCVIMHKPNSSVNYITLNLEDFLSLMTTDDLFDRKGGDKE